MGVTIGLDQRIFAKLLIWFEQAYHQIYSQTIEKRQNVVDDITRYDLPNLPALQFICQQALTGGVTTTLTMDTHGKTLSYALLEMRIPR